MNNSAIGVPVLFLGIYALLSLLAGILILWNAFYSARHHRFHNTICSILLAIADYLGMQLAIDVNWNELLGSMSKVAAKAAMLSAGEWGLILIGQIVLTCLIIAEDLYFDRTRISNQVVRTCVEKIPCGVCYWRDNGRIIFFNSCMSELSYEITGKGLLNGNDFYQAILDLFRESPDRMDLSLGSGVWDFRYQELTYENQHLNELIAYNITEEAGKGKILLEEKERLDNYMKELREYHVRIDESIRKEEILKTKIAIHDEMNRLILATTAAVSGTDSGELNRILDLWKNQAILLENDTLTGATMADLAQVESLAQLLGITLYWEGDYPESKERDVREFVLLCAREAINNAVKHSHATALWICGENRNGCYVITFRNDCLERVSDENRTEVPAFRGGLVNLERVAKEMGGSVKAYPEENGFVLRIELL